MPRTHNGSPVPPKKGATPGAAAKNKHSKRATAKRTTAKKSPPKQTGDEKPKDPPEKERRLNMVERVRIAERIAASRTKPKPDTWAVIAKREGLTTRTCERLYARFREDSASLSDTTGVPVLSETLLLYSASIERLSDLAEYGDSDAVKVGAMRALFEALKARIELLAVMGRMPRSFRAMDELALIQRLLRRMVEVVEKHELGPEVVADFVDLANELSPVIEQRQLTA